ncbi:MAG: hypothetical protein AAF270_06700 [Pseudomonadota bacterium]
MNPNDPRTFRIHLGATPSASSSWFGRALSVLAGAGVFAVAIVAGGFLLMLFLALAVAAAAVIGVRVWWFKRQLAASLKAHGQDAGHNGARPTDSNTVEGEYRVIDR